MKLTCRCCTAVTMPPDFACFSDLKPSNLLLNANCDLKICEHSSASLLAAVCPCLIAIASRMRMNGHGGPALTRESLCVQYA